MQYLSIVPSQSEIKNMIKLCDLDKDGFITINDFTEFYKSIMVSEKKPTTTITNEEKLKRKDSKRISKFTIVEDTNEKLTQEDNRKRRPRQLNELQNEEQNIDDNNNSIIKFIIVSIAEEKIKNKQNKEEIHISLKLFENNTLKTKKSIIKTQPELLLGKPIIKTEDEKKQKQEEKTSQTTTTTPTTTKTTGTTSITITSTATTKLNKKDDNSSNVGGDFFNYKRCYERFNGWINFWYNSFKKTEMNQPKMYIPTEREKLMETIRNGIKLKKTVVVEKIVTPLEIFLTIDNATSNFDTEDQDDDRFSDEEDF